MAKSILNITYFPYASKRFGHRSIRVSSQGYSFSLVRAAVQRGAVVVLMRPGRKDDWLREIPELNGYAEFLSVNNPQNPAISPANLGLAYSKVVDAIRAAGATA